MRLHFVRVGGVDRTMAELKRQAWTGPIAYKQTQPGSLHKQHKPVQRMKRKAS